MGVGVALPDDANSVAAKADWAVAVAINPITAMKLHVRCCLIMAFLRSLAFAGLSSNVTKGVFYWECSYFGDSMLLA